METLGSQEYYRAFRLCCRLLFHACLLERFVVISAEKRVLSSFGWGGREDVGVRISMI